MNNVIEKSSIDELANLYFKGAGEYEKCTSFSAFMTLCHVLFHSESPKFQYMWESLTTQDKVKLNQVKDRVNEIIREKYYNINEIFRDVELYDKDKQYEKEILDQRLLNILNGMYSIKFGFKENLVCKVNKTSSNDIQYLKKINIIKLNDLEHAAYKKAFDGNKFYLLYKSRLLPIFTTHENVRYIDILENTWPFVKNGICSAKCIEFCGWKNDIPIFKIFE